MALFLQDIPLDPIPTLPMTAQWWLQLGFIGAFLVMASITVWVLRFSKANWEHWNKTREGDWTKWSEILLKVNAETLEALQNNTKAFTEVSRTMATLCDKLSSGDAISHRVYELVLGRPCLLTTMNPSDHEEIMDQLRDQGRSHGGVERCAD